MRQATNESQKTPDDYAEAARAFRSSVNELRLCQGYTPFNMANMDQTMVCMDCPASRTNNIIGESSVRITNTGCARRGFTVSLTACASGHKLPAFVILKEPSGKIPTKAFMKLRVPANVRVTASKNGWMSSDKFQEWLSRVWGPNTDDPADVYWNRQFKANLRRSWEEFMRRAERTPKGNLRKPSRQDVLDFVTAAWEAVSEETVAQSFKGCGISNALDGSEEGCLHGQLSDVGAVPPEHHDGLEAECCSLFFDTDPKDSFDGFQSD
ncbi:hypothetical protein HPB50_016326 [Hyalomma asiaticum]|uniref:Uncharacterized protein n=1 Tax=Hyalomma asiaticum TaxID=266040 RepID=A0ACB7RP04_HYAAI|nr:hypothetical protein HPB50_016326 [Hyalomma asiaticum]